MTSHRLHPSVGRPPPGPLRRLPGGFAGTYHYANGVFRCGQCNVILALTDVGEGDGPTMVIPGSHKSNFPHPLAGDYARGDRMDALPGAIPIHVSKGDALLFVDGLMHGGSSRTNAGGERRVTIYRYGPVWGASRMGYEFHRRCWTGSRPPAHRHRGSAPATGYTRCSAYAERHLRVTGCARQRIQAGGLSGTEYPIIQATDCTRCA